MNSPDFHLCHNYATDDFDSQMAPPQEILKEEDLEEIKRGLAEDDPQLDQDAALDNYVAKYKIKGVFFTDTIGRRCVFGPDVIHYKYKTHHGHDPELKIYAEKGHTLQNEIPEYANVRRHDEKGTYFEKRLIKRFTIDATCLRTCKKLYEEGSGILYGGNIFRFEMANSLFTYSSRPVVGSSGVIFHTSATKPGPESIRGVVKDGMSRIPHNHPWRMLPGWLFYDPFLRFLYTIRPRNAALIKHLEFDGIVKGHTCVNCKCCDHDLIRSMRIYVNFMARFCTGLIKLNILACSDSRLNDGFIVSEDLSVANPNNLPIVPPWRPTNIKDGLTKLFEQSISRITTLQKINIRTTEIHYPYIGDLEYYPADFGEDLISRTLAQIQERREKQEDRGMRRYPKKKQCGFCGENHSSRNCYNLCALCGEYGHFKSSCTNWDYISKGFYS
ncbi:hypothetical protein HYALB_00013787 [Hymenoscyphus albidus]|uniref:CCHC-type domain-containing protein n=1 Tax=Hymenoscyphus albidus TaxID=595503 RepID=A0A9N9LWX4_9HELO|nr:hypothetical protein HYALB_00013787 [Hymenoscyphus albidus]